MRTLGPWVEFAERGKTVAIMPAGRAGTICEFSGVFPTDSDACLMTASPDLLTALTDLYEWCHQLPDFRPDSRVARKATAAISKATAR